MGASFSQNKTQINKSLPEFSSVPPWLLAFFFFFLASEEHFFGRLVMQQTGKLEKNETKIDRAVNGSRLYPGYMCSIDVCPLSKCPLL